jgi:hypothetical protein
MNAAELMAQIDRLIEVVNNSSQRGGLEGATAEAIEFLRVFAGPKSAFYEQAAGTSKFFPDPLRKTVASVLTGFRRYVEAGLHEAITPERRAQLDTVSDFLSQADRLLTDPRTHPAAAAVLIGASLEEFLRTWIDAAALSIGPARPGIDVYAKTLLAANLINKQDMKDLTSWAGVRNDAAHGKWELVADPARIKLMLEGVNLFMRQHGA